MAEATRKAALDVLRNRVTPVDEKTQPAALQPFLASVQPATIRQHPATPIVDGAWHKAAFVNLVCTGVAAPAEPPIDLTWFVVDRAGETTQSGTARWLPGATQALPIIVRAGNVGRYVVTIDAIAQGQIAKRIEHVITVEESGSAHALLEDLAPDTPLKGDSRDPARPTRAMGRAADGMSDAQVENQATALRGQLAAFDGQTGAELAQNRDYKRLRAALDELEWQAANRVTDGVRVDTHAPGTEHDPTATALKELPALQTVDVRNRGAVRAQMEALVRRRGIAGAREEIARQRDLANAPGQGAGAGAPPTPANPALYREFEDELTTLEAVHAVPVGFEERAKKLALKRLADSELEIKSELKRYGIVQNRDHSEGPAAYGTASGRPNAEVQAMAAELTKLAELRRRAIRSPRPGETGPDHPWITRDEREAYDAEYQLALQLAVMKYPTIWVFASRARDPNTPQTHDPESFAADGGTLPGPIGFELNQKLRDIGAARTLLEADDPRFNVWHLPRVVDATKPSFRIAPGTVGSAVVDAHIKAPESGGLAERIQAIFTIALGVLMAVPTEGVSLVALAGEATFLISDLALAAQTSGRQSNENAAANTALDPAQALAAESPESGEMLLALVGVLTSTSGVVRAMQEARMAARATRALRETLGRAGGNLLAPEVVAARAQVREWATKAFRGDAARVEAYLATLTRQLGKEHLKVATAVERAALVAEYGPESLARRLGISKITVVEDLKATAQVRHAVEDGRLVVAEVRVGPATTVAELMDHVGTVEAIERYNGLTGRVRRAWDRVVEKVSGERRVNPFLADPGSPGFKIFEEVRKHEAMLRSRMTQLAAAIDRGDAGARGLLQDEISFYEGEAAYWNRQAQEAEAGRGVAGSEGIEARRPVDVHNEALSKGYPKLPENQRYRRTKSSAPGQEYEPYALQSRESAGRDVLDEFADRQRLGTRDPVPEAGMQEVDVSDDLSRRRHEEASVRGPSDAAQSPRSLLARHIPPPGPEFDAWFDGLTLKELDTLLDDPSAYQTIANNIRHPGGLHEWIMVKHARKAKEWGVSMGLVRSARTRTEETVGRYFKHGGAGSTTMHTQLSGLINASRSFDEFKRRLNAWADDALFPVPGTQWPDAGHLGRYYLPPDLQIPPEGVRPR